MLKSIYLSKGAFLASGIIGRSPSRFFPISASKASHTMKNTSLSIPLGNAKGIGGLGATPP